MKKQISKATAKKNAKTAEMQFKEESIKVAEAGKEKAKPKSRAGRPKGVKNGEGKKKQVAKKIAEKPERVSRRKPAERERIRRLLVEHFGASKVEKRFLKVKNMVETDRVLTIMKKEMDQEIALQEIELQDYYEKIDREYKKIGRPKSVFNWREMAYLCSIGCSLDEIAGFFQVSKDVVKNRVKEEYNITFNEYYEMNSQGIKVALRRAQITEALSGDTQMLKFLGKNILGQKEKIDFDGEVKVNSWVDLVTNLEGGTDADESNNGKTITMDPIPKDG